MAVQWQWGLDSSASSVLRGARNLIYAASTDNIQATAILACREFGATLAMCPETCRKIELTVVPAPPPVSLGFFSGMVGYSAGDCIAHLSESLAGVQFLGLATPLVTTLPISQAGDVIATMLAKSAADKTLVPSRRQVTDLLKSIEGRCYHASFMEDVFGWEHLLQKMIQPTLTRNYGPPGADAPFLRSQPGIGGIESLVDAFRQLHRLGESHITRLTIRTALAIPWTVSFVKWCLGYTPSILLEDGTCIFSQENSRVEVIVSQQNPETFKVQLHSSINSLSTLVETQVNKEIIGMIGAASYGKIFLQQCHLKGNFTTMVMRQLIPHCIKQIAHNLVVLGDHAGFNIKQEDEQEYKISDPDLHRLRLSPFPSEDIITETCVHLLGYELTGRQQLLADRLNVFHLPLVKQHIDNLRAECSCAECSGDIDSNKECRQELFVDEIAFIFTTTFVLSLFNHRDSLLIRIPTDMLPYPSSLTQAIRNILDHNLPSSCKISDVIHWALWMVRHDEIFDDPWVMSSNKDQTVWPMIYDTMSFSKRGYLSLSWLPGKLHFENDVYSLVVSKIRKRARRRSRPHTTAVVPVSGPCNLFSGVSSRWQITPEDKVLEASILVHGPSSEYNSPWVFASPDTVLSTIAKALIVDNCCHGRNTQLSTPDPFCAFLDPFLRGYPDEGDIEPGCVEIIAADGSENVRFAALGMNYDNLPTCLRRNACLSCCLKVCRQAGLSVLVL